jgi:hypothetical protein
LLVVTRILFPAVAHGSQYVSRDGPRDPALPRQGLAIKRVDKCARRAERALDPQSDIANNAGVDDKLPVDQELDENGPHQGIVRRPDHGGWGET